MANRSIRSGIFFLLMFVISVASFAQVGISISFGPPPLPVYEQPLCPEEGYLWTPGYWAYDNDFDDYYWVPGTWVMAPGPDMFWTPGYWAWEGGGFRFYEGYWGPQVGFYGGINYGFGYFGEGYEGGRWDHGQFFYNRSVNNVNVTNIRNVYNTTVVNNNTTVNRVSYNGGNGGISARPTPQQEAAARERHVPPVSAQREQVQAARADVQLRASENKGKPPIAATPKPGAFRDSGAAAAREAGGPYTPPANGQGGRPRENGPSNARNNGGAAPNNAPNNNNGRNGNRDGSSGNVFHPNDLPPREKPAPATTGNPKFDGRYQQQQEKLNAKQDQERQKLQQKQDKEHQKIARQNADDARKQQIEQRHQQQTQQLVQKHEQQQQRLQQREQPRQSPPPKEQRPPTEQH